jgi:glycosyltransferase involved in cell wall biosynthesis
VSFMRARGWEMTVVTSPGAALDAFGKTHDVAVHGIDMPRRMSPLQDAKSLGRLATLIARLRPDLVHAHTPKGGLLGTIAAAMARVPARIYHMRGLPMMTTTGRQRAILTMTERTSCGLATRVLANSASLRDYAIEAKLCSPSKIQVLGSGSGNGVDCEQRFNPDLVSTGARKSFRDELGIDDATPLIGFLGRLVRDKGIVELADAWTRLRARKPNAHLVLGGIFEERDAIPQETREALEKDPNVHLMGFIEDAPKLYAAIDILTLPTYREGFPNVLLEASSMRLPIVATKVTGCVDAVVDGITGTLVPARDGAALASALEAYVDDAALRERHGRAGRDRVEREFRRERLWSALAEVYEELVPARVSVTPLKMND